MENENKMQDLQNKLNSSFAIGYITAQSIFEDYIETISELTGKSEKEIRQRLGKKIKINSDKFNEENKSFTSSQPNG